MQRRHFICLDLEASIWAKTTFIGPHGLIAQDQSSPIKSRESIRLVCLCVKFWLVELNRIPQRRRGHEGHNRRRRMASHRRHRFRRRRRRGLHRRSSQGTDQIQRLPSGAGGVGSPADFTQPDRRRCSYPVREPSRFDSFTRPLYDLCAAFFTYLATLQFERWSCWRGSGCVHCPIRRVQHHRGWN